MKNNSILLILLFLVLNIPTSLYADKKVYQARRIDSELLMIDGKLNESVWQDENWVSDFKQWEPYNGEPASSDTKFSIRYDNENLYLKLLSCNPIIHCFTTIFPETKGQKLPS